MEALNIQQPAFHPNDARYACSFWGARVRQPGSTALNGVFGPPEAIVRASGEKATVPAARRRGWASAQMTPNRS